MTQSATTFGDNNFVIQIAGDGNSVVPHLPHLELTLYQQRREVRQDDGVERDADLVSAYTQSIPLLGRAEIFADLEAWLESGAVASLRVLVGTAGRGKTRLALELCLAARAKGWRAGFLTSGEMTRFRAQQNVRSWGWNAPTLIVMDYVASHAEALHDWLVELADNGALGDPETGRERPLRLLLLERQADTRGGWWVSAFGRGGGDAQAVGRLLDAPAPIVLPAITEVENRRAILAAMLERAGRAERPPAAGVDPAFDQRLAELSWGGEPLFLMMAGLAAAKSGLAEALALAPDALAFELAQRERARVRRIAKAHGVDEALAEHMAAVATLCQGLGHEAALAAIAREKAALHYGESGGAVPRIYDALREALTREEGGLEPILPDVIGEAFLLSVWDGADGRDGVGPVVRAAEVAQGEVAASVIRSCQDFAIRGHGEPLKWLEGLGEKAAEDLFALMDLVEALPGETIVLREIAARLTEAILALLESSSGSNQSGDTLALRGKTLYQLSRRLAALGQRDAALDAIRESVIIFEKLETLQPDRYKLALAKSLNGLSHRLDAVGKQEAALEPIEQAVAILRVLADDQPLAYRPELTGNLNNLSLRLKALGQLESALCAVEEAIAIARDLVAQHPDKCRPLLALCLNTHSMCLRELGKHDTALGASEEAVEIFRELVAANPDAYQPDIARSLNNYANRLDAVGQGERAVAAVEEATANYRELAERQPDAFDPDFATSLNTLSNRLISVGRPKEALAAIEEAISIWRKLVEKQPDAFRPSLANSLNNYSLRLDGLKQIDAALQASEEAIEICRKLADNQADAYLPYLSIYLYNQSLYLGSLDQTTKSLENLEEAARTLSDHFLKRPQAYQTWMRSIVEDYIQTCEICGKEPDRGMLGPIETVISQLEETQQHEPQRSPTDDRSS